MIIDEDNNRALIKDLCQNGGKAWVGKRWEDITRINIIQVSMGNVRIEVETDGPKKRLAQNPDITLTNDAIDELIIALQYMRAGKLGRMGILREIEQHTLTFAPGAATTSDPT
jgi:hypothetical protein